MKRLWLIVALLSMLFPLSAVPAQAEASHPSALTVVPAGTKKVDVKWTTAGDPTTTFDAYWVGADDDAGFNALEADRGAFVAAGAGPFSQRFDDLNANTTYTFKLFAIDYTDSGVTVVPPTGGATGAPLDTTSADYTGLTIFTPKSVLVSGRAPVLSGKLTDDAGLPLAGKSVSVSIDPYPAGGATTTSVTTGADGRWSLTAPAIDINTRYWANYQPSVSDPAGSLIGGWTGVVNVEARKRITMSVSPGLTVQAGKVVQFTGTLGGNVSFFDGVQVCLQYFSGGAWGSKKCGPLVDGTANYVLKFQPGPAADGKYRVFSGMGPAYADSWSKAKTITVN